MTAPPNPGNLPKGPVDQPAAEAQRATVDVATGRGDQNDPAAFGVERRGMFGVTGSGDTSGFGGLIREPWVAPGAERPYGGYFDELVDALAAAYEQFDAAIIKVVVDRDELTLYVEREHLPGVARTLRDDPALRFELCSSVSGVDYQDTGNQGVEPGGAAHGDPDQVDHRLHTVYELRSMTYRRRVRLEVSVTVADPHVPSVTPIYPTADWQERETWDMFGIIYDGHPALTRILMPDDWDGHPQRKDYPLGGIPVQYKGASIPPPDERRAYR